MYRSDSPGQRTPVACGPVRPGCRPQQIARSQHTSGAPEDHFTGPAAARRTRSASARSDDIWQKKPRKNNHPKSNRLRSKPSGKIKPPGRARQRLRRTGRRAAKHRPRATHASLVRPLRASPSARPNPEAAIRRRILPVSVGAERVPATAGRSPGSAARKTRSTRSACSIRITRTPCPCAAGRGRRPTRNETVGPNATWASAAASGLHPRSRRDLLRAGRARAQGPQAVTNAAPSSAVPPSRSVLHLQHRKTAVSLVLSHNRRPLCIPGRPGPEIRRQPARHNSARLQPRLRRSPKWSSRT